MTTLQELTNKLGHFPKLKQLDYSLQNGVQKHGGLQHFAEKLGYKLSINPKGYWDKEENVITGLQKLINKLKRFPKSEELGGSLQGGVNKHGGLIYFTEKLGYELNKKPCGYWTKEKTIIQLQELINKLGHFPKQQELDCSLQNATQKYGGLKYFAKKLGYTISPRPKYWTEPTTVSKLQELTNKLGYYPKQKELGSPLQNAIRKNGGLTYLKQFITTN